MIKRLLIIGFTIAPIMAITIIEPVDIASKPNGNSNLLDIGYSNSTGNSDTSRLNLKLLSDYSTKKSYSFIVGEYSYGKSDGKENINKYYIHTRMLRQLYREHIWEIFGQIENNRFQDLSLRQLIGAGVRFKLLKYLYFGSGAMIIDENLKNSNSKQFSRGNIYIAYRDEFNLNVPLKVVYTGYYQPAIREISDYRILQNITLTIPITDNIGLNFKLEHAYDSIPPLGIEKSDLSQSTSLLYKF